MDTTELRALLQKLRQNLALLQEREAKYGGEAPLSLLNQLDDYKKAIDLVKDTLIGDITPEELTEALKPLILDIDSPLPPQPQLRIPPPPQPLRLPMLDEFISRKKELIYFAGKLASTRLAVITGMPGMGKTAMMAMLADFWKLKMSVQQDEFDQVGQDFTLTGRFSQTINRIFWHAFHPGKGIEEIMWRLAAFLAWNDQPELWQMLQTSRQLGADLPPTHVLFDYLFQMLQGQNYLLCFDDFHVLDDDPLLDQFVERLTKALSARDIYLIIASNRMPDFAQDLDFEPLSGFTPEDTRELLEVRGIRLSDKLATDLHRQTGGNTQLLILAINALRQAPDPTRLVANLVDTDNIERYLLKEVDAILTGEEREVMEAVSILINSSGNRATIEWILNRSGLRRILRDLTDRYLLTTKEDAIGRRYGRNPLLQAFYYDALNPQRRQEMHRRAGEYYQTQELNPATREPKYLKAAFHYQRAGDYEQAVRLATTNVQSFINQEQARLLAQLLPEFSARQLSPFLWARVTLARGHVHLTLNEGQLAEEYLRQARSDLAALPESPEIQDLRACTCQWLAELYHQRGEYAQTLDCVQEGLGVLGDRQTAEAAELTLIAAQTHIRQGNYEAAEREGERSLKLAQRLGQMNLLGRAYNLLGRVAKQRGANTLAIANFEQALSLYRRLDDLVGVARTQTLIGAVQFEMG